MLCQASLNLCIPAEGHSASGHGQRTPRTRRDICTPGHVHTAGFCWLGSESHLRLFPSAFLGCQMDKTFRRIS